MLFLDIMMIRKQIAVGEGNLYSMQAVREGLLVEGMSGIVLNCGLNFVPQKDVSKC